VDTVQSDLQRCEAVSHIGLLGPGDSVSFSMDSKSQPSSDLNIKLQDEVQCCLASNEQNFNPLNGELNPICHLLTLLRAHPILHVSRIRVNVKIPVLLLC